MEALKEISFVWMKCDLSARMVVCPHEWLFFTHRGLLIHIYLHSSHIESFKGNLFLLVNVICSKVHVAVVLLN